MRNVVTLSHLDPELHDWLKQEAQRRTKESGTRVHAWQLVNTAVREFKAKQNHDNPGKEAANG